MTYLSNVTENNIISLILVYSILIILALAMGFCSIYFLHKMESRKTYPDWSTSLAQKMPIVGAHESPNGDDNGKVAPRDVCKKNLATSVII